MVQTIFYFLTLLSLLAVPKDQDTHARDAISIANDAVKEIEQKVYIPLTLKLTRLLILKILLPTQ